MHGTIRRWGFALTLAASACQRNGGPTTPSGEGRPAPVVRPVTSEVASPRPVVATTASADAGAGAAPSGDAASAARAPMELERVAAVRADALFGIGGGRLYRFTGGRWERVPLEGAEARDLVVARHALWVLGKGTGPNHGRALVIRSRGLDDLLAVATPLLGEDSDPRALAVAREGEFYIGGERPPLVHVTGGAFEPVPTVAPGVVEVHALHDDWVFALHSRQRATAFRWGEYSGVDLDEDYLATLEDPEQTGYTLHARGEIARGRASREFAVLTVAAPFAPRVGAILADGTPAVVGAGGPFARWLHHEWHAVSGGFPAEPIGLTATEPPLVVGRHGEVVAVQGETARVLATGQ